MSRVAASSRSRNEAAFSSASMTRARSLATRIFSATASASRAFTDALSRSFTPSSSSLSSSISVRSPGTISDSLSSVVLSMAAALSTATERDCAYRSLSRAHSSSCVSCCFTAAIARVRACCSDSSLFADDIDETEGLVAILLPSAAPSGVLDSAPSASSDGEANLGKLKKRSASDSPASLSCDDDREGCATGARTRSRGAC